MNAAGLLNHFDRIAEAPDAVERLRRFVLHLAVRGKLVEQLASEYPAIESLREFGVVAADTKSSFADDVGSGVPRGW